MRLSNCLEEFIGCTGNVFAYSQPCIYFSSVITWIKTIFPKYRKEMKGVEWGYLYNQYGEIRQDANKLEEEIARLMQDDDVTKKSGIYAYVLSKNEKYLNIRAFTENMKRETYERQKGICPICGKHYEIEEMDADHITPWCEGGKTNADNCQMLCRKCNRRKSNKFKHYTIKKDLLLGLFLNAPGQT